MIKIKIIYYHLLKYKFIYTAFFIFLVIAFINSLYFSYPDEFESILGGYYIDHGRLPYIGFFTHHAPFAYFFASIITIFSGASFVKFRLLLAVVYTAIFGLFFIYTKKRFGDFASNIFLTFSTFLFVGATYFWGHMLLADSLSGLLIIPAYSFLFYFIFYQIKPKNIDLIILSVLFSATLLTSLTYIYAVIIGYIFLITYFLTQKDNLLSFKKLLKFLLIIITPYLIFLIYLILTKSLGEFYYQAVFFNQQYYITMPDGTPVKNPVRFAVVLFFNFFQSFRSILSLSKEFNLSSPFADALAVSDLFMIIYLVIKRKFKLALLSIGFLVYLNGRSNPSTTTETDYQAIPYQYFSMFNGIFLLFTLWKELKEKIFDNQKIIFGGMLLILGIYYLALGMMFFDKGFEKAYLKFMGKQSLIYDRPLVANEINSLLSPQDYYYVGPFAFEDHLYIKEQLPTKYIVTIPAMDQSEKIQSEMLADFRNHKPKLVVFDTEYPIFGKLPGLFLVNYLKQNYVTIEELINQGAKIQVKDNNTFGNYKLLTHFYMDPSYKDELLNKLASQGYITLN